MQNKKNINRQDMMVETKKAQQVDSGDDSPVEVKESNEKSFEEGDCESDYEDQLDAVRGMKRRRKEDAARTEARRIIPSQFLPASNKKLSACTGCRLVLNKEKWRKLEQCPNCPQS